MNISTVASNLRNTIAGKEMMLAQYQSALREEIEAILDACAADGFRVQDLMHALVQSRIFLGSILQP